MKTLLRLAGYDHRVHGSGERTMTAPSQLSTKQRGVALGMAGALVTGLVVLWIAHAWTPAAWLSGDETAARLDVAAWSVLVVSIALLICIARLAKHRFFTPVDIEGSGLTEGSARAKLLQALLQNTLEQLCLAGAVYFAAALLFPRAWLGAVPAAATLFLLGRVLFFARYEHGAPARAYGFALTFYPTVILLAMLLVHGLERLSG